MMILNNEMDELTETLKQQNLSIGAPGRDVAAAWPKSDDDASVQSIAAPPVWTQYIEDRLKQFCTR